MCILICTRLYNVHIAIPASILPCHTWILSSSISMSIKINSKMCFCVYQCILHHVQLYIIQLYIIQLYTILADDQYKIKAALCNGVPSLTAANILVSLRCRAKGRIKVNSMNWLNVNVRTIPSIFHSTRYISTISAFPPESWFHNFLYPLSIAFVVSLKDWIMFGHWKPA